MEHKSGSLHVVPDTLSRLFGNVSEDTTVRTSSVSGVLHSQPIVASICRNVPDDGLPYHPPSPRAYKARSDNLSELSLVERDRDFFANAVNFFQPWTQRN